MTRPARKLSITPVESLEARLVLSATPAVNLYEQIVDLKGGPTLGVIYTQYVNYVQGGSQGAFNTAQSAFVAMEGSSVGIDVTFSGGNFLSNAATLQQEGMVITAGVPSANIIEGFMPLTQLPSVAANPNVSTVAPVLKPTQYLIPAVTPAVPAGPLAATPSPAVTEVSLKGGPALGSIYQEYLNYEAAGGVGAFTPIEASKIYFSGTSVGVDIRTTPADFSAMLFAMQYYGMDVTATVAQAGIIEGFLPIGQLPTVATNLDLVGMSAIYKPSY